MNCDQISVKKKGRLFVVSQEKGKSKKETHNDRSLRVYDIYSANELHVSYGHESRIRSLTVSSDERIFSAGDAICVWKWIDSSLKFVENDDSTIYITGIEDKYKVFSSMEKPKLITMIGSNGVKYQMIAKKGDELRKDARVLDFCRKLRQLHIRTYSVIPLQARGGLIEVDKS
uniref:PI3K/PI4K catalytic domain-containing protein n=1 Tax=Panagrolaimus superbus TaxID=310955 RepID=A0A914XXD4_9BILA